MKFVKSLLALVAICAILVPFLLYGATLTDLKYQTKNMDFADFTFTRPFKVGSSLPGTCSVGYIYFKSDAAAGSNIYQCTSTNTWTQVKQVTVGTSAPPGTCTVGDFYLRSTGYTQLYYCAVTNIWYPGGYLLGTSDPSTCAVGQILFRTDLTAGQNLKLCTSANTWTAINTVFTSTDGFLTITNSDLTAGSNGVTKSSNNDLTGNNTVNTTYISISLVNETGTGTTANNTVSLSAGKAIIGTASAVSGIIGICTSGNGTSGSCRVVTSGVVNCQFDASGATQGNYVIPSSTSGRCKDGGSVRPLTQQQILGRVLAATCAANASCSILLIPEIQSYPSILFTTQTDAATITWAIASSQIANATVTLAGNRTLNITNPLNGGAYILKVVQDGTGSRTLTLGTGCTWKVSGGGAGAITPTTTAAAIDILAFTYDGTNCYANFQKNFS